MIVTDWKINFDEIEVSKEWNFPPAKEDIIHRIHSYPAKFPAFLTTKAIEYSEQRGGKISAIGDLFCGCGTTAYEAKKANKDYWGWDINPVATLIAKVKSSNYNVKKLEAQKVKILKKFIELKGTKHVSKSIYHNNDRILYWYDDTTIDELSKLKKSISTIIQTKGKYNSFFLVAFSNILKPTSRWLTKSIKPQIDPHKKQIDVLEAFTKQVEFMIKGFSETLHGSFSKIRIENTNILKTRNHQQKLDLIVSSPPYVTSYEYADLHQLSTLWLDYVDDYRELRSGTIGSVYNINSFKRDVRKLNVTAEKMVFQLYNKDKSKAKSAARYYVDMQESIRISYEKLNDNGIAFFVIGNTEYKNVRLNNAKHLLHSMIDLGFQDLEIIKRNISNKILTPFRDIEGKFTTSKDGRKVYSEEYLVIGRKQSA